MAAVLSTPSKLSLCLPELEPSRVSQVARIELTGTWGRPKLDGLRLDLARTSGRSGPTLASYTNLGGVLGGPWRVPHEPWHDLDRPW